MGEVEQTPVFGKSGIPELSGVGWGDIWAALGSGISDFLKAPQYGLLIGAIYALGGLAILAFLTYYNMPWMILPIAIGFPLLGPFVAGGLYEVSRRLSAKQSLSWKTVLLTIFQQRERQLGWMAFVVMFIFMIWIFQVRLLIALLMGFNTPSTLEGFIVFTLTTQQGLIFLAVGTLVGAVLALVLFACTVIAMPLLLDVEVDFVTAMITSFAVVFKNPAPMLGWGIIVTLLVMLSMVPAFLGVIIVFPILGHATWHLYTRAVVRPWAR